MASRVSLIQSRSIYVGTLNSVAPSDGNLIVTGNVGIGTTSPSYKLDVSGDIRSTNIDLATQGVNVSSYGFLSQTLSGQMTFLGHNVRASNTVNNTALVVNGGWISSLIKQYYNEGITFHTSTTEYAAGATYPLADTERMRITSAGNVGIGTTSPGSKLHVYSGSSGGTPYAEGITAESNSRVALNLLSGAANDSYVFFGNSSSGNAGYIGYDNTANRLILRSSDYVSLLDSTGEVVRIDGGNVGIGTTSPAYKLHVNGEGNGLYVIGANSAPYTQTIASFVYGGNSNSINIENQGGKASFQARDSSNNAMNLHLNPVGGNVGIGTTGPAVSLQVNASTAAIRLEETSASAKRLEFSIDSSAVAKISANQSAQSIAFETVGSERMRITNTGNVGIGTTSPGEKLSVNGFSYAYGAQNLSGFKYENTTVGHVVIMNANDSYAQLYTTGATPLMLGTNNSVRAYITSDGNVGIGTTNPRARLNVWTPSTTGLQTALRLNNPFGFDNLNTGAKIVFSQDRSTAEDYPMGEMGVGQSTGFTSDDGYMFFSTRNSGSMGERMRIVANGNVGIGTTSPSEKLHVVGTGYFTSFVGIAATTTSSWGLAVGTPVGADGAIKTTGSVQINSGALAVGSITPSATAGRIDASNDIVAYSTSDSRLKENVTPIANALDKVKALTGVQFDWKAETASIHGYEGHDVGVIAQDVQAVLPEAVRTNDSGYLSVRYEKMIALLIEANKELANRVELLEQKLKQQ